MVSHCFAFCLTQKAGEWWVFLKNGSLISRFSADSDSCMHCMKIIWRLHKMFTEKWRLHNGSCTWHNMHMTYHICRLRKHTPAKVSGSRFKFQLRHWQLRSAEKSAPAKKKSAEIAKRFIKWKWKMIFWQSLTTSCRGLHWIVLGFIEFCHTKSRLHHGKQCTECTECTCITKAVRDV